MVLSWGAPGWSWAPLGALRAPLGAVLGALRLLLGPPGARLGLIWASRGAPFGASWASVEGSLAKSRNQVNLVNVQHLLIFYEVLEAPKSHQNRRRSPLCRSCVVLGGSWVAQGPSEAGLRRSEIAAPRGTQVSSSPKVVYLCRHGLVLLYLSIYLSLDLLSVAVLIHM